MIGKKRADEFAQGKDRLEEIGHKLGSLFGKSGTEASGGGGFLGGLGGLIDQLGKLAQQAEQAGGKLDKTGEFNLGQDGRTKGVYGFSVRSGLGQQGEKTVKVEPFGNMRREEKGGEVVVQEIREPMVDVFDEPGHVLIVAEVPGITQEDVQLELQDDILILAAEKGETKYRKEVLLPISVSPDRMSFSCRNGILEIRLAKEKAKG